MHTITDDMIDELFVRFFTDVTLYNNDMAKFFWQLEKMYWYYLDIMKIKDKPSKDGMKIFLHDFKDYLLCLLPEGIDVNAEYEKWIQSRKTIPRCKVILLDEEKENMLLTKGVFNDYVIFPGGKVEEYDNNLVETAIRETYEEIGFDITDKIDPNSYFDMKQYGVQNRYFVISNIDKDTFFLPNVVNEIEYIKWFPIRDFPDDYRKHNLTATNVRLIKMSVPALKSYIANGN